MENKHEFYMRLAEEISKASYCVRSKVGALIEREGNIIAFGYNGTPKGFDNSCEIDENTTNPVVLHAESNAIMKCASSTSSSKGATLYCTVAPCFDCAKLIIQSGIVRVYYKIEYRLTGGLDLLTSAGIPHIKICQNLKLTQ